MRCSLGQAYAFQTCKSDCFILHPTKLCSRLIFPVFHVDTTSSSSSSYKKNILKKITNVAYISNEWCACCVSSIVIYINNIKYCGIIHYVLLLMQLKKDIKSVQLNSPQKRRQQQQHSIFLVLLHSVNNSHQSFQLLNFNLFAESRAKPRLVPNSQRTTANHTFPPAQVIQFEI